MLPGKYCLPALSVRRLVPACVPDIVHHTIPLVLGALVEMPE